jgi:hypothetical protein
VSYQCGGLLRAQANVQVLASPPSTTGTSAATTTVGGHRQQNYPSGLECAWRIDAPAGSLISLTVCQKEFFFSNSQKILRLLKIKKIARIVFYIFKFKTQIFLKT